MAVLRAVVQQGGNVEIAFDADKPGELMAWRVAQQLPTVEPQLPAGGKDWNEQLMGIGQAAPYPKQLTELCQWHSTAFALGRSQQYLNRIGEVAMAMTKGTPFSEKAKTAMKQDFSQQKKTASIQCDVSH